MVKAAVRCARRNECGWGILDLPARHVSRYPAKLAAQAPTHIASDDVRLHDRGPFGVQFAVEVGHQFLGAQGMFSGVH
jgi:hypothetical protein